MAISATHHPEASRVKGMSVKMVDVSSFPKISSPPNTEALSFEATLLEPPDTDALSPDAVLSDPP
eukprot:CAMPEP_0113318042 /NCGR_PEP_ID=MMETSP0010_2-20120614/12745_1 /TAXON_ID=216773 ORGANISM="Corethron hystrix, Strain 308" /NCGR_SAMPLE_ID=MMETSP0010_2 /ASSEMBLY_ACC=CAM_ASM_000155 /LENGTH=64 /DNA_ID=CAMNT_0000175217 /DNA_START=86 /DNA_END=277 /DNA_ORIENTATION=- /assembly_acc=CAM_ASM_000155